MVDVYTPAQPTYAGCYGTAGYTHETICTLYNGRDRKYTHREICVNANAERGLHIVDVTDKQHPQAISTATYPNVGYTYQG